MALHVRSRWATRSLIAVTITALTFAGWLLVTPAQASEVSTVNNVQTALGVRKVVRRKAVEDLIVRVVSVKHARKAGTQYYAISRGDYGDDDVDTFGSVYPKKAKYCAYSFFDDYGDTGLADWEIADPTWDDSWDDSIVYVCPLKKGEGRWYEIVRNKKARRYAQRALNRI